MRCLRSLASGDVVPTAVVVDHGPQDGRAAIERAFPDAVVLRDAARQVYRRLMDAVDESLVDEVEQVLEGTPGVRRTGTVRVRWIGHTLRAEAE